ncbi:MAG TPA: HAMP domain-containing sensor histidine kinase [Actinocrinis sp.]|jgi:two-component system sensor histidine kinase MprB|uniref:sensor histidine kinase n=1 Tax=Actinocrinis sp. TaxID=1920516 RepID=UPI002DDCA4F7|nr:HAMP domain-containing sensor histidine kinase [Actinocrinis sp.]HEV3171833.1 HAMP domain-containing sensor histidine kinase [Actinocrinis sp.]
MTSSGATRLRHALRRMRSLKLRTRITLAATLAVSLGIGAGVLFAYLAVRAELFGGIDNQLGRQVQNIQKFNASGGLGNRLPNGSQAGHTGQGFLNGPHHRFGDTVGYIQSVSASGKTSQPPDQTVALPVDNVDKAVAAGTAPEVTRSIYLQGVHVRMVTAPLSKGSAIQVAVPLTSIDDQLSRLGLELLAVGAAGILLAAVLGWWVTRTALRPVGQLTAAAERIARTRDLAHRIDPGDRAERDELGRLATSFNAMLGAVQDSTERQRQLVADASHELRTPLTSLRTNVEVLRKIELLEPDDRERLIASVLVGIDDLTALVADTVELARGEEPPESVELFRWDELADRVVERARLLWSGVEFAFTAEPCVVAGVPDRLQRAMANLVDNAAKFSGGTGLVEIKLKGGTLTVRDDGPGILEADLPHVFNRFYRAASMRDRPGSGLGLAIVAQVAESHGGAVTAANDPGGGAVLSLSLPLAPDQSLEAVPHGGDAVAVGLGDAEPASRLVEAYGSTIRPELPPPVPKAGLM